ncbi:MAG: ROK family protein [Bacteroidota bacterium]
MDQATGRQKKISEGKAGTQNIKKLLLVQHILEIFYKEGVKTISELCDITNSSIPSLTTLMGELSEKGLVKNFGIGESKGGRKPALYGLDPDAGIVIAINLSQKYTRTAAFNLHNDQITPLKRINLGLENAGDIFPVLKELCNGLIDEYKLEPSKILGYGITIPGLIDIRKGVSYSYPQFEDKPLGEVFSKVFDKPVFTEHDTKAMALGEAWFGLAKEKRNVLFLNIGSGIGLGIIINGELYHGNSGFCGEFGHIPMNPDGELCYCGKIGCLETVASGSALVKKSLDKIKGGKHTIISRLVQGNPEKVKLRHIIDAATNGDLFAIELIEEAGEYLAKGISILIHLFNPEAIIIGGEMADAGNLITDPVQQKLNKYTMLRLKQDTTLLLSELKEKSGLMGTLPIVVANTLIRHVVESNGSE